MQIDRTKINMMPLIMGPLYEPRRRLCPVYCDVESLLLQYKSDPDAIRALLPECYAPAAEPIVTVGFMDARSVDFLAGNGYRLASVSVSARYDGNEDHLDGRYVLVMFENDTTAIVTGREQYGIPKVYADITPVRTVDPQHLRCEASLWGHLILGIDVTTPLKSQNAVIRKAAAHRSSNNAIFGYKYIPAVDDPPDADYPMVMWVDYQFDDLWLGSEGELYFGEVSRKDIGHFYPLVEALKSLPVRSVIMTSRARGRRSSAVTSAGGWPDGRISAVMLATSLAPDGYLGAGP